MNTELQSIVEGPLPGIYSIGMIQGFIKEQKVAMLEHIASDTPEEMSRLESTIAALESKYQAELRPYQKTIQTAQGRELFEKLGPLHERFNRIWSTILPLSRAARAIPRPTDGPTPSEPVDASSAGMKRRSGWPW